MLSLYDAQDTSYAKAAAWAKGKGIVSGISEAKFSPNGELTREQLVTILYNYAKATGKNVNVINGNVVKNFNDWDTTANYAKLSMKWASEQKILREKALVCLDLKIRLQKRKQLLF